MGVQDAVSVVLSVAFEIMRPMADSGSLELNVTLGDATFQASGASEVVMNALAEFKALVGQTPPSIKRKTKDADADNRAKGEGPEEGKKLVLPLFLKEKNPRGNPLTATAIVAWAEVHDGKTDGITAAEALRLWKSTSMKPPGNLARDMASAAKEGLLDKSGRTYTLTGHGKTQLGLPTH